MGILTDPTRKEGAYESRQRVTRFLEEVTRMATIPLGMRTQKEPLDDTQA